jgi:prepilin-type processing-associated H-X9-DG protein
MPTIVEKEKFHVQCSVVDDFNVCFFDTHVKLFVIVLLFLLFFIFCCFWCYLDVLLSFMKLRSFPNQNAPSNIIFY